MYCLYIDALVIETLKKRRESFTQTCIAKWNKVNFFEEFEEFIETLTSAQFDEMMSWLTVKEIDECTVPKDDRDVCMKLYRKGRFKYHQKFAGLMEQDKTIFENALKVLEDYVTCKWNEKDSYEEQAFEKLPIVLKKLQAKDRRLLYLQFNFFLYFISFFFEIFCQQYL